MPPPHEELRWAKRGVSPTTNNKVSANIHSTHYMHLFYARRRCAHLVWMPLSCPSLSFAVHRREVTYNGARIGAHVDSRGEMTKCEVAVCLVPSGPLPFRHGGRAAALIVLSWSAAIDSKTAPSFTLTDSTADPQCFRFFCNWRIYWESIQCLSDFVSRRCLGVVLLLLQLCCCCYMHFWKPNNNNNNNSAVATCL